jgi:hypothetical protein
MGRPYSLKHHPLLFYCFSNSILGNIPKIFLEYSWNTLLKVIEKIFLNHDNFFYSTLKILALKICQNMSLRKKLKLLNMFFYYLKTLVTMFYFYFFIFFIHLINFKFIHKFP